MCTTPYIKNHWCWLGCSNFQCQWHSSSLYVAQCLWVGYEDCWVCSYHSFCRSLLLWCCVPCTFQKQRIKQNWKLKKMDNITNAILPYKPVWNPTVRGQRQNHVCYKDYIDHLWNYFSARQGMIALANCFAFQSYYWCISQPAMTHHSKNAPLSVHNWVG